jgi:hypothetical protein
MLQLVMTCVAGQMEERTGINSGDGGHLENDIFKW